MKLMKSIIVAALLAQPMSSLAKVDEQQIKQIKEKTDAALQLLKDHWTVPAVACLFYMINKLQKQIHPEAKGSSNVNPNTTLPATVAELQENQKNFVTKTQLAEATKDLVTKEYIKEVATSGRVTTIEEILVKQGIQISNLQTKLDAEIEKDKSDKAEVKK